MAYTPNTWATGDTITAAKLNNMEQGIASAGGGILVVDIDAETDSLTKTWQEISDAGMSFLRTVTGSGYFKLYPMSLIGNTPSEYFVEYGSDYSYAASSASEYPVYDG